MRQQVVQHRIRQATISRQSSGHGGRTLESGVQFDEVDPRLVDQEIDAERSDEPAGGEPPPDQPRHQIDPLDDIDR